MSLGLGWILYTNNLQTEYGHENWHIKCEKSAIVTVSKELSKYRLDLVGVQEVRWNGGATELAGEYTFFYGKRNEYHEVGTVILCIRESYQQLRGLLVIGCCT
jgi:choline kinase